MDISYKRELNHSYLILKNENQQALSDYPAKMLFSNSIKGLLPCIPRLIDGETSLYYEITSRQSLSQIYETKKFNSNDLKALLFFQHGTAYICRTGQQLRRANDAHLNIG